MILNRICFLIILMSGWIPVQMPAWAAESFSVATYNLERYIGAEEGGGAPKNGPAKAKVRESIRALNPDVLAVQEIGAINELQELRRTLAAEGQNFPYFEYVAGYDKYLHVAVLSKYPIVARRPHPQESFLLNGRRFHVSRGIAELDISIHPRCQFTLITAHLKSRRPVPAADEAELREQEAIRLREIIDARLAENPRVRLVVAGDLNDTKDSVAVRTIVGRGKMALIDTRPAEHNGDEALSVNPRYAPRDITWTHFYGKEDTYSRIDFILLSPEMARAWQPQGTYVLAQPNWGVASDHRPLIASFMVPEK